MSNPAQTVLITRGKFQTAHVAGRTIVQITALDNETFDAVELLLPPGYVAVPMPSNTADPLVMQIGARGSHKVAIGGDDTADAVVGLQPGEMGLSRAGQSVLLRLAGIVITSALKTQFATALLEWAAAPGGPFYRLVNETFLELFNSHTHGSGPVPDQPMTASNLTGGS